MSNLVVHTFLLVIPDDRGGLGMTDVGHGVWFEMEGSSRTLHIECMAPTMPLGGSIKAFRFAGRAPHVWQLVATWLEYAVAEPDGTLVAVPEGVWKYARRSNLFAEADGL